jgi:hypothetical protein
MTTPIETGTLGTKLLSLLMQYIRHEEKPWGQLTSDEQQDVLEGMQERIDDTLKDGVISMLAGGLPRVAGILKSVTAKDTTRAAIDVVGAEPFTLHNLIDRVNGTVVIVPVGPEEHAVEIEKFQAEPNQRALDLPEALAGTLADPLCLCGHLRSSHTDFAEVGETAGCQECTCELFELEPIQIGGAPPDSDFDTGPMNAAVFVPCDRGHPSPVCADPNCWQSPTTTVGADDEDDDDE